MRPPAGARTLTSRQLRPGRCSYSSPARRRPPYDRIRRRAARGPGRVRRIGRTTDPPNLTLVGVPKRTGVREALRHVGREPWPQICQIDDWYGSVVPDVGAGRPESGRTAPRCCPLPTWHGFQSLRDPICAVCVAGSRAKSFSPGWRDTRSAKIALVDADLVPCQSDRRARGADGGGTGRAARWRARNGRGTRSGRRGVEGRARWKARGRPGARRAGRRGRGNRVSRPRVACLRWRHAMLICHRAC